MQVCERESPSYIILSKHAVCKNHNKDVLLDTLTLFTHRLVLLYTMASLVKTDPGNNTNKLLGSSHNAKTIFGSC